MKKQNLIPIINMTFIKKEGHHQRKHTAFCWHNLNLTTPNWLWKLFLSMLLFVS